MANRGRSIPKTATEALHVLWMEGFFRDCRRKGAIEENLGKRGNHFSGPELGMALKRARHLTRRGRQGSYEYIQKYPFAPEVQSPGRKKAGAD